MPYSHFFVDKQGRLERNADKILYPFYGVPTGFKYPVENGFILDGDMPERAYQQLFPALKIVIDDAAGQAGPFGHLSNGGICQPIFADDTKRRIYKLFLPVVLVLKTHFLIHRNS